MCAAEAYKLWSSLLNASAISAPPGSETAAPIRRRDATSHRYIDPSPVPMAKVAPS